MRAEDSTLTMTGEQRKTTISKQLYKNWRKKKVWIKEICHLLRIFLSPVWVTSPFFLKCKVRCIRKFNYYLLLYFLTACFIRPPLIQLICQRHFKVFIYAPFSQLNKLLTIYQLYVIIYWTHDWRGWEGMKVNSFSNHHKRALTSQTNKLESK